MDPESSKTMLALLVGTSALVVQPLHLGGTVHSCRTVMPTMQFDFFQPKKEEPAQKSDSEGAKKEEKKGIDLAGLAQLMTMGAGAPSLGEFTGMEDNKMMFELGKHARPACARYVCCALSACEHVVGSPTFACRSCRGE